MAKRLRLWEKVHLNRGAVTDFGKGSQRRTTVPRVVRRRNLEESQAWFAKMSDRELLEFGRDTAYICTP
jgi:hypothetical protein